MKLPPVTNEARYFPTPMNGFYKRINAPASSNRTRPVVFRIQMLHTRVTTPSALGLRKPIVWMLIVTLVTIYGLVAGTVRAAAWWGFGYVAVFSMWLGFFAWYRGLALGGTVRVSQVQLVQPFLSMLFAVPLLGESLDVVTVGFSLAVIATVFVGKRMPVKMTPSAPHSIP